MVRHIARHTFDARYGARPLQRYLETYVVTPISRLLIGRSSLSGAEIQLKLGIGGIEVQV